MTKELDPQILEHESHYRLLPYDTCALGIVYVDAEGLLLEANDKFLDMVGYTRTELENRITWLTLTPPEHLELDRHALREILEYGYCTPFEKQYIRKDGSRIDILVSGQVLPGKRNHTIGYIQDITKQKQAERELKALKEQYQLALQGTNDAIWVWNLQTGELTWNDRFYENLGFKPGEVTPSVELCRSLILPTDLEKVYAALNDHFERDIPYAVEIRVKNAKTGEYRHVLSRGKAIKDPKTGKPVQMAGTHTDLTERIRSENALRVSEARFRRVVESDMMGFIFWEKISGKITDANNAFLTMLGYTREELLAGDLNWRSITPQHHYERDVLALEEMDRTGKCAPFEKQYIAKDGNPIDILIAGAYYEAGKNSGVAYTIDITQQKQAQRALRESESRFQQMADTAPVMIWTAGKDSCCDYFNQPWLDFTGQDLAFAISNDWSNGVHPDDLEYCLSTYHQSFEQRAEFKMEYRLRRHDAQYRWIQDHGVPRFTTSGEFFGYIGSCIDIDDRKQMEMQLEEAKAAAEAANRQKSEFLAMMSHELRTPLNSILGYARMIENGMAGELTPEQARYIHNVGLSGNHLLNLVNDLLDISKAEAGKMDIAPGLFEIRPVIVQLEEMMREMAEKKQIQLIFELQPGLSSMEADPARFKQILINLVSNALKFNRQGGQVFVRLNRSKDKQWVIGQVEDTGIGIAPEALGDIFNRFFQGDTSYSRPHEGTGLGLALTRELVQIHGGEISVESQVGKGSVFTFRLPVRIPTLAWQETEI